MNLTLALARARALTRDEPNSNPSPVGRLAGVQIVVNETTYPAYPQSNRRPSGGWFTAIGDAPDFSSLAIHFKDPAKLCSAEAGDDVAGGSIGDRLWIRLGTASAKAADFEQLPLLEEAMQATIQYSDSGSGARAAAFLATSSTLALRAWDNTTGATSALRATVAKTQRPCSSCTSRACSSGLASYCSRWVVYQPSEACSHLSTHRARRGCSSRPVTRRGSSRYRLLSHSFSSRDHTRLLRPRNGRSHEVGRHHRRRCQPDHWNLHALRALRHVCHYVRVPSRPGQCVRDRQ